MQLLWNMITDRVYLDLQEYNLRKIPGSDVEDMTTKEPSMSNRGDLSGGAKIKMSFHGLYQAPGARRLPSLQRQ